MAVKSLKEHYDNRMLRYVFPHWYSILYATACIFLIPWIVFLSILLPPHYVSHHWDVTWVGFDVFEFMLFAITALLAIRHSIWTALTSVMLGTTLLIDAWFDIMTSRNHRDFITACIEAFILELPLAILSFVLARRIFEYARTKQSD